MKESITEIGTQCNCLEVKVDSSGGVGNTPASAGVTTDETNADLTERGSRSIAN